jgi:hypothetical protein
MSPFSRTPADKGTGRPGGQTCETKPISRRCRVGRGLRDWAVGHCTNKPNFASDRPQEPPAGGAAIAAGGDKRTKQSQFTSDGQGRPSPRPEALTLPPVRQASAPNKPNLAMAGWHPGANRAKRTQFGGTSRGWEPAVSNKANSGTARCGPTKRPTPPGGLSCKTKPICRTPANKEHRLPLGTNVRNEANSHRGPGRSCAEEFRRRCGGHVVKWGIGATSEKG